ncbi:MYOF protein, partial [Dyaphorophyia castanea]|nr:MYOF protein [Platysteira castanea]
QVLAWGLRGLRGAVREPRLELQWGEQSLWTPPIEDVAANPNFPSNAFVLTLAVPEDERLVPPIRLRLWDRADTERRLLLGRASVRGLGRYRCPPPHQERLLGSGDPGRGSHTVVWAQQRGCRGHRGHPCHPCPPAPAPQQDEEEEEEEEERDWWSKFYTSVEDKEPRSPRGTNGDRLKIYGCELEAVPEFEGLQDFCQTFPLYKPGRPPLPGQHPEPVGSFKGLFRIYPVPEEPGVSPPPRCFQRLPPSKPQECLVRVYVVRAFDLSPRDVTGLSDPYVRVALGKKTLGQRDQYVPNTLEPVFGRMFELTATIPLEKDLRVTIMDYDKVPPDQEIGSTTIDLENRLLSHFRAHCGLPTLYHTHEDPEAGGRWVLGHLMRTPRPRGDSEGTARPCVPRARCRCGWTSSPPASAPPGPPSTSTPARPRARGQRGDSPSVCPQGKVQMWVDIFPTSLGPPGPPVNIDPRKAEGYELRCVVWNVRDVDLADTNLLGQRMSDIYVTGWLDGLAEQRQQTDIHYRSRDGKGAFNWRFVFPFEFLAAEKLCAISRKEHVWSLDETLLKVPPKLILQVWDNDKFKADDLLGILELELTRLPRPAPSARLCRAGLQELPWCSWPRCRARVLARSPLNLFRRRRARGWWPCIMHEDSGQRLSGKLELTLELLTAQEAEERPVGKGREEPNKHPTLPEPRRPKSSFLWLQSPLSLVRHGVRWRYFFWAGLAVAAFLLLLLLHSFF